LRPLRLSLGDRAWVLGLDGAADIGLHQMEQPVSRTTEIELSVAVKMVVENVEDFPTGKP
jgi:hypothetical protein